MVIKNHIVWPLLTDKEYVWEWIKRIHPEIDKAVKDDNIPQDIGTELLVNDPKIQSTNRLFNPKDNVLYWVTETVLDKLDLLKVKKKPCPIFGEKYDWTVFNHIKDCKKTFILPDNDHGWQTCLRVLKSDDVIQFLHLGRKKNPPNDKYIWSEHSVTFFVDSKNGIQCEHFKHEDVKVIETFIYKLLCFIWLSENEEVIIKPGAKQGTRKQGKIINSFSNIPITIINSKWNITSIRTEGFDVSGHFRVLTKKYSTPRTVWVKPYSKKGLKRRAKSEMIKA